jgi:manganese/zinc/iron transport system permease protein
MSPELEIQLIAVVVAAACALPGVFLVLRRLALMSDVISHAILPGIVLAFFLTQDLSSPLLVMGAALMGVLTVGVVGLLERTGRVREDAAMGLVFPVLFSLGVILIARYAGRVHLDVDIVLLGELAFAPFDRLIVGGLDLGPKSLYVMGGILLINVLFIVSFYKELKLSTFDAGLAAALGFSPALIHYGLMALVAVTAVGAFEAVGSILVVALMIAPPAAAYLLTDSLARMLGLSVSLGVVGALGGYRLAYLLDASIAGSMAAVAGVIFASALLLAPERGLLSLVRRRMRQRWEFAQTMLLIHLLHHEGRPEAATEAHPEHLHEHLRWEQSFTARVVRLAQRNGFILRGSDRLLLTERGRERARRALM